MTHRWWAPRAWVGGRWRERVLLSANEAGYWTHIEPDSAASPHVECIDGPVIPSLVDAHSHAFQRAFVGLAERRDSPHDDFWSWRDRMYGIALRMTPDQLQAVAAHLYAELLAGGYTQVCEFAYLHHAPDGSPYADPALLSQAMAASAAEVGIGLTLLPVLYERAGFTQPALRDDQRRFATTVDEVFALQRGVKQRLVNTGVAVHSLRAARPESIAALAERAGSGPIHIHVAEQTAEVDACLSATGCRPVEWLTRHAALDARWQLVHATHVTPQEIEAVTASGAGVVFCPGTEANLGDGVPDLRRWLASGLPLSVGSDSQVVRNWPEELRLLEYSQRLTLRERNVSAHPQHEPATAARLFERMRTGGAAAAGFGSWGFDVGARADLLVLNGSDPALRGLPRGHLLDGVVFAAAAHPFLRVMVAGAWIAPAPPSVAARFEAAMHELWAGEA